MANVIKTVITYPLNGSTRDFNIPFEYLARKFVQVTLIGRDRKPLTNIDDYRFTSKNQITTNRAWGTGDGYQLIELRRFTSATERLVDFSDGSILRAYDLNVSQIQTLHVAEEARDLTADTIGVNNDGDLDARGRRIVNLADPVNEMDAVNLKTIKEWNNGAYQSYLRAKEEAEKAARSAAAAKTSESNAHSHMTQASISEQRSKASETAAESSKNAAAVSAQSSAQSASSASNSAQEAIGAKEYTKQQADRSYKEAERAKGYADGMGHAIDIGYTIENMEGNFIRWKGNHEFNQYVGVMDKYPNPSVGIQLESSKGSSIPLISVLANGNQWRYYGFNTDNPGTLATQEWANMMVSKDEKGTYIHDTNKVGRLYVLADGTLHYSVSGVAKFLVTTSGELRTEDSIHALGDISTWNKERNARIAIAAVGNRAYFSKFHSGTWVGEITIPDGDGTMATREWVGKRISEEFFWKKSTDDHDKPWSFLKEISSIPSDCIFSRVVRHSQYDVDYYLRRVY